jgi:hypothetical protein
VVVVVSVVHQFVVVVVVVDVHQFVVVVVVVDVHQFVVDAVVVDVHQYVVVSVTAVVVAEVVASVVVCGGVVVLVLVVVRDVVVRVVSGPSGFVVVVTVTVGMSTPDPLTPVEGPAVVCAVVVVFEFVSVAVAVVPEAVVVESPDSVVEGAVVTAVVVPSEDVTMPDCPVTVVVSVSAVVTGSLVGSSVMRSLPPLKRLLSRDTAERIASLFHRPTPRRTAHPRAAAAIMFLRIMIRLLFCFSTYSSRRLRTRSAISSYDLILKSLLFKLCSQRVFGSVKKILDLTSALVHDACDFFVGKFLEEGETQHLAVVRCKPAYSAVQSDLLFCTEVFIFKILLIIELVIVDDLFAFALPEHIHSGISADGVQPGLERALSGEFGFFSGYPEERLFHYLFGKTDIAGYAVYVEHKTVFVVTDNVHKAAVVTTQIALVPESTIIQATTPS